MTPDERTVEREPEVAARVDEQPRVQRAAVRQRQSRRCEKDVAPHRDGDTGRRTIGSERAARMQHDATTAVIELDDVP